MPRADEVPATREQWEAMGLGRARLSPIDASDVLDWELDDDGAYAWIKTRSAVTRRSSPSAPLMVVETYRVYTATTVTVYRTTHEPRKRPRHDHVVPAIDQYDHGFARVPVTRLCLPDGLWLVDRAADSQIEHFRLGAALSHILQKSAHPTLVFNLRDQDSIPRHLPGEGIVMGADESASWIAAPSGSADALAKQIGAKRDEIYRVSQQMALSIDNSSASLGRSGLSKMADKDATEVCLRGYATFVREAIEATYELVSDARGDDDVTFSVEGMSEFSSVDMAALVETAQMALSLGIASTTLHRELALRISLGLLPNGVAQEQRTAIRDEIMSADVPFKASAGADASAANVERRTKTITATPRDGTED
jgi:hypothetical protein